MPATRRRKSPPLERRCPVDGCKETHGPQWALCKRCWAKLPSLLRLELTRTREQRLAVQADSTAGEGTRTRAIARHREAIDAAVRWLEG